MPLTREQCEAFMQNPTRNPLSNATLRNPNAEIGRMIRVACEHILRGEPVPEHILASRVFRGRTPLPQMHQQAVEEQPAHRTRHQQAVEEQPAHRTRHQRAVHEQPTHRTRHQRAVHEQPAHRTRHQQAVEEQPTHRTRHQRAVHEQPAHHQQAQAAPARRELPTTYFIFGEQEISHEEVAIAIFQYGRRYIDGTLNQYYTHFIRPNTTDFQRFKEAAYAYYPDSWLERFEKAGRQSRNIPRITDPYPRANLEYASPTFEFNGNIVSYRQAIAAIYSMRYSIANGLTYSNPPFIRTIEDTQELLSILIKMFPESWIRPYIIAANDGSDIPRYVPPPSVHIPSPSNKPKSLSSKTPALETVADNCKNMFRGVLSNRGNPFKKPVNRMLKICQSFVDKCDNKRIKDVRKHIHQKRYTVHVPINEVIPSAEQSFTYIYNQTHNKSANKSKFYKNFFRQQEQAFYVKYADQEGVGQGVFRDFIKNCLNAVKNDPSSDHEHEKIKFFMPTYTGSGRCVINPRFDIEHAKKLGYKHVKTEDDILQLYHMIGQLFALSTRIDYPVPVYLSRSIVASMLYKQEDITPEMSFMYYILDSDPSVVKSTLDLLNEPHIIDVLGIYMNDDYPLVAEDGPVDVNNYITYIDKYCRYKYLHRFEARLPDTNKRLKAFIDGFYILRDLKEKKVTVRELDKMMCGAYISIETIKEWLATDHITYLVNPAFNQQKQHQVITWFKEILHDMGDTIPLNEINTALLQQKLNSDESSSKESDSTNKRLLRSKKRAFLHFFMRLMEFWTSYGKIDMESAHQVRFERQEGLPTSHTCFRQLCLTCEDIHSKAQLYSRLITAVFGVEKGIGLY